MRFSSHNIKTYNRYAIVLILCYSIQTITGQDELFKTRVCIGSEDCGSCLRAGDFCYWCDDSEFHKGSIPACNVKDILQNNGCPPGRILGNKETYSFISEDKPLSDVTSADPSTANQIKPQRVSVEIKPGDTHSITFEYRLAKNYPLDLYYLMDLTWSMRDDKETLVGLKYDLPVALKRLTDNFKLGFGSFADKPLMPYTAMDPKHRENPCSAELSTCEPTYTYRHRLSLTNQVERFVTIVNETGVTGNLDNMEATLEALMQVLVCDDKIGWSANSRKIVILATDGQMHFAGMGKLGGVVKRNDENCYVDDEGSYSESTSMDYPSLSQIDRVLRDKRINVIFAVTEEVKQYYDKINELLPDTTYIGRLEADSSNILNLVRQGYEDFSSVINFKDDAEDFFQVKYYSNCGGDDLIETSKCEPIKIGENYKFVVNITMKDCKADHHGPRRIVISETQLGNQALVVDLNLHCKCECAEDDGSIECPENAALLCGKCTCLEGWMGPNCDCNINDADGGADNLTASCIPPVDSGPRKGIACSGAGDCFCGTCLCDPGFTGDHCECKECYKDLKTNNICGGPSHGICSCGECVCRDGYEGPTCSCPTDIKLCTLPGDEKPCSGRGICRCGECECSREGENKFAGKFCDVCTNCDNPACQLYEGCARAAVLKGTDPKECVSSTGALFTPTVIDDATISVPDNVSHCYFDIEENGKTCKYPFTYQVGKDWTVDIQVYERTCWGIVDTALLALPAFLATVLLGLLVIAFWKCATYFSDKKAYAKFAAERDIQLEFMKSQEENPIYKSPISSYKLPDDYNKTMIN